MIDGKGVANGSWNILATLILSIEKSEILINKFETLFLFATNNLHNQEIQRPILKFILGSFIKIPFNKGKTIKGLEYVNFAELATSFFTNLFSILKSHPAEKDKFAVIDCDFYSSVIFLVNTLFGYCDDSIFDELLPIFTLLASDEEIIHCNEIIKIIISDYCFYCNQEQSQKIRKLFKRQLDLQNHSFNRFYYLLNNYTHATLFSSKTVDSIKQTIESLLKYTKNKDKKIKGSDWKIICSALSIPSIITNYKVCLKKELMNENNNNICEFGELDDFDITYIDYFDNNEFNELYFNVFNPILEKLLTSKDPNKIVKILKKVGGLVFLFFNCIYEYSDGSKDDKNIDEKFNDSIHIIPDLIKKIFL